MTCFFRIGLCGALDCEINDDHQPHTNMKKQIVSISILQSSKIATALYVLMGLLYSLVGIPMLVFGGEKLRVIGIFYLFGPIWMGILGFIFFVIIAALYNALARVFGGIEFELKDVVGEATVRQV
jgi:hypothetical protein